jgi:ribosomal protein S18 acetylase RimI-like enzyme
MPKLNIRTYLQKDEAEVITLWRECGLIVPWNNPETDIARKCADSPELFFIAELGDELVASCMAGYDGHCGWIYFLAVKPTEQRQGIAAKLISRVEQTLIELGCPKLELMVRKTNNEVISFYSSIGFGPDPVMVMSKRLIEDQEHDYG